MDNTILSKYAALPDEMQSEVGHYIDFLFTKVKRKKTVGKAAPAKKPDRKFGSGKGMFTIKPDFDEPMEDFKEYM
jgi:hypothetical protein